MLPALLPHPVELAARSFNALTAQETWARETLARHAGKRIMLVAGGWRMGFLVAADACLEYLEADEGPFDVTLTLPADWWRWPQAGAARAPLAERMHISGDAGLAQALAALAQGLRWDVEDTLARWIGDVPAVRLGSAVRRFGQRMQQGLSRLAGNTAEYLAEETHTVLGVPECRQWQLDRQDAEQQIQQLAQRTEALQRRLARLETATGRGVAS